MLEQSLVLFGKNNIINNYELKIAVGIACKWPLVIKTQHVTHNNYYGEGKLTVIYGYLYKNTQ